MYRHLIQQEVIHSLDLNLNVNEMLVDVGLEEFLVVFYYYNILIGEALVLNLNDFEVVML